MKKSEIQALLIVFGLLIGFCSYQFIFKKNQAELEQVERENEELKLTVNRLEGYEMQRGEYIEATKRMKEDGEAIIVNFAPGLLTEDVIMYLYGLELVDANDVVVPSVTMETGVERTYGGALTTQEGYELVDDGIRFYSAETTTNIVTTNSGLKNIIRYIYSYMPRKSVSEVSLTVLDNGYLSGTMLVDFYYMTGTEIPYQQVNIPAIVTGTDNIFGARTGNGQSLSDAENAEGAESTEDGEGAEDADGEGEESAD